MDVRDVEKEPVKASHKGSFFCLRVGGSLWLLTISWRVRMVISMSGGHAGRGRESFAQLGRSADVAVRSWESERR